MAHTALTLLELGGGCSTITGTVQTPGSGHEFKGFEHEKRAKPATGLLGLEVYDLRPGRKKAVFRIIACV